MSIQFRFIFVLSLLLIGSTLNSQTLPQNSAKEKELDNIFKSLVDSNRLPAKIKMQKAKEVVKLASQLNNRVLVARAQIIIGDNETERGDPELARKAIIEAIRVSKEINNEFLEAKALLSYSYLLSFRMNKADSALIFLKKAHSIAISLRDTTLLKISSVRFVRTYKELNDPVNAIHYAKSAIEYNKNDALQLSDIYRALGIVYNDVGSRDESIKCYVKALEYSISVKDDFGTANIMNNLAGIYLVLNQKDKALENHDKALKTYQRINYPFGVAYTNYLIGSIYSNLKNSTKAIEYYQNAIKYFRVLQNSQHLAFNLANVAAEYINLNKLNKAESYITEAISVSEKINDKLSMCSSYITKATLSRKQRKLDESIKFLKLALKYAKEIHNIEMLEEIYNELSVVYSEKGSPDNALSFLRLKNEIEDTITKQNANRALIEMMVKYETVNMKEEIQKAKGNVSQLESESKTKTILMIAIIGGGGLLIFVIVFIYWKKISSFLYRYNYLKRKPFNDARNVKAVLSAINKENVELVHLNKVAADLIFQRLKKIMEEEKIFLNPELTLADLAKRLETNTTYLSRIINDEFFMNFSNFLNKYRIEEAKNLIDNHKQDVLTFEGIAKSCGFTSRSSFNQSFKKFTDLTPSQYSQSKKTLL